MPLRASILLLLALPGLWRPVDVFAAPVHGTPQVEQCDGSYSSTPITKKASPQIRMSVQAADGLKVGQQPSSVVTAHTLALWRFDGTYSIEDSGCTCSGGTNTRYWSYRYADANGSPDVYAGQCVYTVAFACSGGACAGNMPAMALSTTQGMRKILPTVDCPASTSTLPSGTNTYTFKGDYKSVDTGCLPQGDANCRAGKNCRIWTYHEANSSGANRVGRCAYSANRTIPDCTVAVPAMALDSNLTITPPKGLGLPNDACPASTETATYQMPAGTFNYPNVYASGKFTDSLQLFNSHYALIPTANIGLSGDYTLSAWVKTSSASLQRILSHQDASQYWGFGLNGGALRRFDSRENGGNRDNSAGSGLNDGNWHHVAVVRKDGVGWRFFADGGLVGTTGATFVSVFPDFSTNGVVIGSYGGGGEFFNGQIDDLRVLDTAYSDDSVALEYWATRHKFSTDGGSSYSYVDRNPPGSAYSPAANNGDTVSHQYLPAVQANLTSSHRYIFMSQDLNGQSTISSPYYVTKDNGPPPAPLLTGTPWSTTQVLWSWAASTSVCGPPEGTATYALINAANGQTVATVDLPSLSILEGVAGIPNQFAARLVKVTDGFGSSPLSNGATAYTKAADPSALSYTGLSTGSISFQWNGNSNPSYTRYEVDMATSSDFGGVIWPLAALGDDFNGTQKSRGDLQSGTTYHFRVRAKNGRSSDSFGTLYTNYATNDFTTLPAAPPLLGIPLSTGSVRWDWSPVVGAFGYKLYGTDGSLMTNTAGLTYSLGGLSTNTIYGAAVEAYGRYGTSGLRSPVAYVATHATSPVNVAISALSTNTITVSWESNGNSINTYYEIVTATNTVFAKVISTTGVVGLSGTVSSLFPATTYYFKVRAVSGTQAPTEFAPKNSSVKGVTYPNPGVAVGTGPVSAYNTGGATLTGWWHFDQGSGTSAADSSPTGNNGTLTCLAAACSSTPTFTAGAVGMGSAALFSGITGSLVKVPSNAAYSGASMSVGAWVRAATAAQPNGAAIVAKGAYNAEDFSLDVFNGKYRFMFAPSKTVTSTITVRPGEWDHVMGVADSAGGGAIMICVNGTCTSSAGTGSRTPSGQDLTIGSRRSAAGFYDLAFSGAVDEVRFYNNDAFTQARAAAERAAGLPSLFAASDSDGVQISIAPDAFGTAYTNIYVSEDPVGQPIRPGQSLIDTGLAMLPTGHYLISSTLVEIVPVVDGVPFTGTLNTSATVYISYPDTDGDGILDGTKPPIYASTLKAYTFVPSVLRWDLLPGTVNLDTKRVAAATSHFSVFGLFGSEVYGNSLSRVRTYPAPWKIGSGAKFDAASLTFDRLPTDGTVTIYSLAGEKIVQLSFGPSDLGKALWNGNNYIGQPAASGIYFAFIKSKTDNAQRVVKFVVER